MAWLVEGSSRSVGTGVGAVGLPSEREEALADGGPTAARVQSRRVATLNRHRVRAHRCLHILEQHGALVALARAQRVPNILERQCAAADEPLRRLLVCMRVPHLHPDLSCGERVAEVVEVE